ncbi:MAG TPA: MATE family efflux transporter [Gemmatimonadaceae bacterium]|nr:MATE family efflux transporter [Gemmatimonadaceae bacterium]
MSSSMSEISEVPQLADTAEMSIEELRAVAAHGGGGEQPSGSLWTAVREALAGSTRDYTSGPVSHAIFVLAVPMVLEMVMESVFAVCDVFFVSRLGASAVATVGLTESWLTIVYGLAMGLAIAATATVARRTGERDREGAAHAAAQSILLALAFTIVLGGFAAFAAPRMLALMGASSDVLAIGSTYARIMLGGNITIVMLFLINAIFRGAGDAVIAMRVLWLANAINILLGPCLIFGLGPFPRMGVAGAALATNIGRGTGALFALSRLLKPGSRVDLHVRHFRFDPAVIVRLARLAWSASVQLLIGMGSWIALIRILSTFGSNVLAGYTIGVRLFLFALLPAAGLANAAATMVGQALGAKKPERAARAVRIAGTYNMVVLTVAGAVLAIFARTIAGWFTQDPAVLPEAAATLRTVAYGFPFYAWGMVMSQSFNGAGDTRTPTLINIGVFWCWELPIAYLLGVRFGYGPHAVYLSITIAFSTYAVVAAGLFNRGTWKTKTV